MININYILEKIKINDSKVYYFNNSLYLISFPALDREILMDVKHVRFLTPIQNGQYAWQEFRKLQKLII